MYTVHPYKWNKQFLTYDNHRDYLKLSGHPPLSTKEKKIKTRARENKSYMSLRMLYIKYEAISVDTSATTSYSSVRSNSHFSVIVSLDS